MKIQWYYDARSKQYSYILSCLIGISLVLPYLYFYHIYSWRGAVVIAGISLILGIILSPIFGRVLTRRLFRKRFGFRPSPLEGMRKIEQRRVDQVLHDLAIELDCSFIGQTTVYGQPIGNFIKVEDIREREEKLREWDRNIRQAKKRFWNAHFLAKSSFFSVKQKYADYLSVVE